MTRIGFTLIAAFGFAVLPLHSETAGLPDLQEVLGLLRSHLSGASEAELNHLAVEGLLTNLHGKVTLVGENTPAMRTNLVDLAGSSILESNVAYLRVSTFDAALAHKISNTLTQFAQTNKLIGLVLDLRFAEGDDYGAAAAVADLFQSKRRPLIDWGAGSVTATEKTDAIRLPVSVLVNRETAGAAEALAAVLRETGVGLLLGTQTEGSALLAEDFPLKNGRKLRIAITPVKVGDGLALTTSGLKPDIEVAASLEDDRGWLDDPYGLNKLAALTSAGRSPTNQVAGNFAPIRRPRTSEADLVRARRDRLNLDAELAEPRPVEPARPVIRDATLARAVDLLKGLAVVRASRS